MDRFQNHRDAVSDPARSAFTVVPQDDSPLSPIPKAIFVGSSGDVEIRCIDDDAPVSFRNVPAGTILPIRAMEVRFTGTTASDLVALV